MTDLTFQALRAWPVERLARLFADCFEGYLLPVGANAGPQLARMLEVDDVDAGLSRVVRSGGRAAGIGLIAERDGRRRVAAMAIMPSFRSRGLGRELLRRLVEDAAAAGARELRLEVIAQNAPAVRLYTNAGFVARQRLFGYSRPTLRETGACSHAAGHPERGAGADTARVDEIEVERVLRTLDGQRLASLPWQLERESLHNAARRLTGYALGTACALVEHAGDSYLRMLYVPADERGRGSARRLLRALPGRRPDAAWKTAALVPEAVPASLFTRSGFVQDPLSQLEMSLDPGASPS